MDLISDSELLPSAQLPRRRPGTLPWGRGAWGSPVLPPSLSLTAAPASPQGPGGTSGARAPPPPYPAEVAPCGRDPVLALRPVGAVASPLLEWPERAGWAGVLPPALALPGGSLCSVHCGRVTDMTWAPRLWPGRVRHSRGAPSSRNTNHTLPSALVSEWQNQVPGGWA